jgi:hypothetical protein
MDKSTELLRESVQYLETRKYFFWFNRPLFYKIEKRDGRLFYYGTEFGMYGTGLNIFQLLAEFCDEFEAIYEEYILSDISGIESNTVSRIRIPLFNIIKEVRVRKH